MYGTRDSFSGFIWRFDEPIGWLEGPFPAPLAGGMRRLGWLEGLTEKPRDGSKSAMDEVFVRESGQDQPLRAVKTETPRINPHGWRDTCSAPVLFRRTPPCHLPVRC